MLYEFVILFEKKEVIVQLVYCQNNTANDHPQI